MNPTSPASDRYGTTLRAFIAQLQPREWNLEPEYWEDPEDFNSRWQPRRFFDWPPDAFLLTALLLETTGAYRAAATLYGEDGWPRSNWSKECKKAAAAWRNWLCTDNIGGALPDEIQPYLEFITRCKNNFLNDLYDVDTWAGGQPEADSSIWDLCVHLLELHAIADETMRGVGTVYSPKLTLTLSEFGERPLKSICHGIERVHMVANTLLTLRGTLSRIGKHRGIVLPKTRTPQVGLTIRTFSHYLSFHRTEVDVAWRAVPWTNIDENTVNALIVPWPYHIAASDFRPELTPQTFRRLGNVRYFSYQPGGRKDTEAAKSEHAPERDAFDPARIVEAVKLRRETNRVHLIVFPEAALLVEELDQLKTALGNELRPHEMPLIISGLSGLNQDDRAGTTSFNRVCLSTYFAEKWYDMTQHKHHRWRLDPAQIANYGLGGVLSGTRNWWEAIPIPRRRLSFLTSNAWLTVAPLICEDLARLDPVSDLIRGVGPTLLIALLLDGPQLPHRWPARYAGVFAEDPGTSVLTVTALGMSKRSRPDGLPREETEKTGSVVALWKDQFTGWKTISVSKEEELATLTVATRWIVDDTVDRSETEDSAVFVYQGLRYRKTPPRETSAPPATTKSRPDAARRPAKDEETRPATDETRVRQDNLDMCELSLYTFFVDAIVDSEPGGEDETLELIRQATRQLDDEKLNAAPASSATKEIAGLCGYTIQSRTSVPDDIPTPQFLFAISDVAALVRTARALASGTASPNREETDWDKPWQALVTASKNALDRRSIELGTHERDFENKLTSWARQFTAEARESQRLDARPQTRPARNIDQRILEEDLVRLYLTTPSSVLWAIHNRLSIVRRSGQLRRAHARLLHEIETTLQTYDRSLYETWRTTRAAAG
ncbi:MAG TPA: hypothetical protein VM733_23230 [Thermoanaerobaculia bacterium]|nr:hypothetical protein [Thermoanaerobaculia bacterium]